jgi:DNA-binding transcriptional regulator YhcF (GntR family)
LPPTLEFLAQMLGVERTGTSLAANTLQQAGIIRYRRGRIEIVNLAGLREVSRECYAAMAQSFGGPQQVQPRAVITNF